MNLTDPTRSVTPTLDGTVLAVLAAAGRPLSVGQVAEQTARGSEIGVRRCLARLVDQGIVRATLMGRNHVHELNREHVAAAVADVLANLRTELWRRLRLELHGWKPRPMYAAVFGSAARGDGDEASDLDLLLVHPPFRDDVRPASVHASTLALLSDAVASTAFALDGHTTRQWQEHVDRLRDLVQSWTGNPLQVVDLSFYEWRQPTKARRSLLSEIQRDAVEIIRPHPLLSLPGLEETSG